MNKEPIEKQRRKPEFNSWFLRLIDILSNYPNGCPLAKAGGNCRIEQKHVHRLLQLAARRVLFGNNRRQLSFNYQMPVHRA